METPENDLNFSAEELFILARAARAMEYVSDLYAEKLGLQSGFTQLFGGMHKVLDEVYTANSTTKQQDEILDILEIEEEAVAQLAHNAAPKS